MYFRSQTSGTANIQGMHVSYGDVTLGTGNGNSYTLSGVDTITNHSTFTAVGGRYSVIGLGGTSVNLSGSMTVSDHSVANFSNALLAGHGTFDIEFGSIVDAKSIVAGTECLGRQGVGVVPALSQLLGRDP